MATGVDMLRWFLGDQRGRFEEGQRDKLSVTLAAVIRYREFLGSIADRYMRADREYLASFRAAMEAKIPAGQYKPGDPAWGVLVRPFEMDSMLQLEVESFYLFARILLDRIVKVVTLYFGRGDFGADSHSDMIKAVPKAGGATRIERYAARKGLTAFPGDTLERMRSFDRDLTRIRDEFIVHDKSPRGMTSVAHSSRAGQSIIVYQRVPAREGEEPVLSRPPTELLGRLDEYLEGIVAYMKANEDKAVTRDVIGAG